MIHKIQTLITNKINRSNDRSTNTVKNIIASFGIKGISILVQLLLVPLTINYVNPTQYGIWLTLSSIIGWFSFFDIGFGNGLRNRFAEAKATGDYDKAKAYVSTTYICIGVIFTIVWILFLCVNCFIDWSKILNAPAQMAKELSVVALIVFSFFCMQILLKTINTVLIADQRPAKSAFIDMLGQVLVLLFIFILTKTTHGSLLYLSLALGISPILIMIFSSLWFYKHEYKPYKPSIRLFDKKIVLDIVGLGSKFFIIQIGVIIIYQTNNIIIAQICGNLDVTIYNIAFKYFSIVNMILTMILVPIWSAYTDAYVRKDIVWMKSAIKVLERIWLVMVIILFIMLLSSSVIYKIWIGDNISIPFAVSLLVSIYMLIMTRAGIYLNPINGIGKIKIQMYSNIICCILNIPIAIFLGLQWGLPGIILANICIILPNVILYPIQLHKILNNRAKGIWNK
jgi:O-antigen/teichoic acid export membrane protein